MRAIFRKTHDLDALTKNDDNWMFCLTGNDKNNIGWNVTVQTSEYHRISRGAEGDAELIARLLNWYYDNEQRAEEEMALEAEEIEDGGVG